MATQSKKSGYGAKSIQVLEGLDPVRKRPGMYIGGTSLEGLHHLIWEVVNNSIDEAMAGYCDRIVVRLLPDNIVEVVDNGRGIPVEKHPQTKKSTLETVLTVLHAGGKFGGGGYKMSGGLHGVGVSVVNALSVWTRAEISRDGKIWMQEYKRGKPLGAVKPTGKSKTTGTTITFQADPEIFPEIKYSWKKILDYLRWQAYLTKGVHILIEDARKEEASKRYAFYFDAGIISFVDFINRQSDVKNRRPIYIEKKVDEMQVEVALQYTDSYKEHLFAFANNIHNPEGGMHVTGFKTALTRVFNDYAKKHNLLKEKEGNFTSDDLREGLTAVVSVKLPEPQFEGQTKAKLGNSEARGIVSSVVAEGLAEYLEAHPADAKAILQKCLLTVKARIAARAAKDAVLRKGALEGMTLPGKLADCSTRKAELSELYIVEGDSAGGCFSGDTKIALADGRNVSFQDLAREQKEGKEHFVYTIRKDKTIGLERAVNARVTKKHAEVVRVTLDNGEQITCTPDHRFMLRDGRYGRVKDLKEGDSLMPLYKKISDTKERGITIDGYEMVWCPRSESWLFTHILADWYNRWKHVYKKENGVHCHHVDFNKRNNNPTNIIRVSKEGHLAIHREHVEKTLRRPEVIEKCRAIKQSEEFRKSMSVRMKREDTRKILSQQAKEQWKDEKYKKYMVESWKKFYGTDKDYRRRNKEQLNEAQRKYWRDEENREEQSRRVSAFFEAHPERKKELSIKAKDQWSDQDLLQWRSEQTKKQWTDAFRAKRKWALLKTYYDNTVKTLKGFERDGQVDIEAYQAHRVRTCNKSLLRFDNFVDKYFSGDTNQAFEAVSKFNHRIVKIEKVLERMDVYDIEVPGTHNFALAGGVFVHNSAKQGRDRQYQAILPLRGKLVNVEKTTLDKVVKSDTLKPIIIALGAGIGESLTIDKLRYHKIIIMADADVDGSHIRTLLLTFFYRYYEDLIKGGYIYIAQPPLYGIRKGKKVQYAYTDAEKNTILKKFGVQDAAESQEDAGEEKTELSGGVSIQRYKGLGEMNPELLWETTMDPENRVMYRVRIEDAEAADKMFDVLMGREVEPRRRFIQTHAKHVQNLDV